MAHLIVRPATPDDAADLARLLDHFDNRGATPSQVAARRRACHPVLTTFLGELEGQSVGFACLRLVPHLQGDEPYAELTDIFVEPLVRRQGVARALLGQVEATARAAGATEVVLLTGFENVGAQAAYRASGYERWALAMRKRLMDD